MVEISEVVDRETLEAYLDGQPKEVAQVIAARSALRVWPALVFAKNWQEESTRLIFAGQRAMLISGVASTCPTPEIRATAAAAADAAFAVNADASAFWEALRADLLILQTIKTTDLTSQPLWAQNQGEPLGLEWAALKADLSQRDEGWEVWFPLYEALRDGTRVDWDRWQKVALLPGDEWREDDVAYTNGVVAGIFASGLRAKTPWAEELVFDEATRTFDFVPSSPNGTYDLNQILRRVEHAMSDWQNLSKQKTNESLDDEIAILQAMLDRSRDYPAEVFDALADVTRRLIERFGPHVDPDTMMGADQSIDSFRRAVENSAIALLDSDEDVARGVKSRAAMRFSSPQEKEREQLDWVAQAAKCWLAEPRHVELERDLNTILNGVEDGSEDMRPRGMMQTELGRDAAYRMASRLSRIGSELSDMNASGRLPEKVPEGTLSVLTTGTDWKLYFWRMFS